MPPLTNHTVLLTGATGALGLAIAKRFLLAGANLLLASRNTAKLDHASQTLTQVLQHQHQPHHTHQHTPTIKTVPLDVTDHLTWQEIARTHKPITILINCAGVSQARLLPSLTTPDIKSLVDINLTGAIYGCKFVGRRLALPKSQEDNNNNSGITPSIINISSLLAKKGVAGTSVYSAAKAGLVGLTTSLAVEYGRMGIRVNAILPGYIESDMTAGIGKEVLNSIPLNRMGHPNEVADAAYFLAMNQYANNCILNLDGGLSAT